MKNRFFYVRYCSGLSARAMSKLFDMSQPYWGMIERDTTPGLKTVRTVSKKLGIPLIWLLEGEGEKPTPEHIEATIKQLIKAA